MKALKHGKYLYYIISLLFLITGLFGIKALITKADLPFTYSYHDNKIISDEQFEGINPGDMVYAVDGIEIKSIYQLETILDNNSIGEDANAEMLSAGNTKFKPHIHLARYYRKLDFIIISFLAGLSFWITSVFLIVKKHSGQAATVLFFVLMLFSLATMTSPGKYFPVDWISCIVRASHVASYFLGAIVFLHFTFVFPRIRIKSYNTFITTLYIFSILFCIILITAELISISDNSSGWVFTMETLWIITEALLLLCIFTGIVNLYLYYRKINNIAERKKTEWIFWGLATGVCPFLLLWLLPRLLGFEELVKEEYLLVCLILVPVFFAMAVIRYHALEINVFIKSSILYSILTILTVIIYKLSIMIILFFAEDLVNEYHTMVTIFIILLEIFLLSPVQRNIKTYIDKSFYKFNYDFEKEVCNFSAGIKDQNSIAGLCRYVINEIEKIIPVKKIAIVATAEYGKRLRVLSQNNFDELPESTSSEIVSHIKAGFNKKISVNETEEQGINADNHISKDFKRGEIDLVIPFTIGSKNNFGAILIGDKLSGLCFMKRDIEILNIIAANLELAFYKFIAGDNVTFKI